MSGASATSRAFSPAVGSNVNCVASEVTVMCSSMSVHRETRLILDTIGYQAEMREENGHHRLFETVWVSDTI